MDGFEQSPLYRIMHPASVAFWGASSNPMGMGSVQLSQMLALGFEGPVYPMHPREQEILGLKAYHHLKDVPGPVDLAVLVLPTKVVPEILEECGKSGVTRAIIVSAGFGEKGSDGKELQNRIVEIARKYGIHFIGPNCIEDNHSKLNTTFFLMRHRRLHRHGLSKRKFHHASLCSSGEVRAVQPGSGWQRGDDGHYRLSEYLGQCPDTKVTHSI
jgi:acyl-CoA synthetase (NDP forming)